MADDIIVGVDVGGTFTDLLVCGPGGVRVAKVPTTVDNQAFGVLAALDERRLPELPDVPTLGQAGVNVSPLRIWGGYAVRAGTPEAVVQRLHAAHARRGRPAG